MAEFMAALNNPNYKNQKNARADYVDIARDEKKAKAFLLGLCWTQALLVNCVTSCVVPMAVYNNVSSLLDLRTVVPPYALGARMSLERVSQWEQLLSVQEPVECIFEEGDFEQGKFTDLMMAEGRDAPIYKKKNDFAGLQASDHYAWEINNYLKSNSPVIDPAFSAAVAVPLSILAAIPTLHIQPTQESLINLCHKMRIDPRTGVKQGKP
jgi:hypothetical protein